MIKLVSRALVLSVLLTPAFGWQAQAIAGLNFNFTAASGTSQQAIDGFTAAGALWSNVLGDNITVNMNIGFTALGGGILGQTSSTQNTYAYTNVRTALVNDQTSASDQTATSALQTGSVNMLINRTSNSPNGSGSATPYLDNNGNTNNTTIRMTNANAKALGLLSGTATAVDASITFNSNFNFDFTHNASHLAASGGFDFIGIAAHEIGHALGFISGVDVLDLNSPPSGSTFSDAAFTFVNTLDLFRYSGQSAAQGVGVIDWTADNRSKYFSIDGGVTNAGATFSTGVYKGDGSQASHWKDNLGLGIMDPTAAPGELLSISANDLLAFDVIGYNLQPTAVPEPSSLVLLALGGVGMVPLLRRAARVA